MTGIHSLKIPTTFRIRASRAELVVTVGESFPHETTSWHGRDTDIPQNVTTICWQRHLQQRVCHITRTTHIVRNWGTQYWPINLRGSRRPVGQTFRGLPRRFYHNTISKLVTLTCCTKRKHLPLTLGDQYCTGASSKLLTLCCAASARANSTSILPASFSETTRIA